MEELCLEPHEFSWNKTVGLEAWLHLGSALFPGLFFGHLGQEKSKEVTGEAGLNLFLLRNCGHEGFGVRHRKACRQFLYAGHYPCLISA